MGEEKNEDSFAKVGWPVGKAVGCWPAGKLSSEGSRLPFITYEKHHHRFSHPGTLHLPWDPKRNCLSTGGTTDMSSSVPICQTTSPPAKKGSGQVEKCSYALTVPRNGCSQVNLTHLRIAACSILQLSHH